MITTGTRAILSIHNQGDRGIADQKSEETKKSSARLVFPLYYPLFDGPGVRKGVDAWRTHALVGDLCCDV